MTRPHFLWRFAAPAVALAAAVPPLARGLRRDWLETSDMDITAVYQTLLLGGRLPQESFDHTGYLHYLLLSWWYRLGLGPVASLQALPAPPGTDAVFAELVYSGRALMALLAAVCAVAVHATLRVLGVDRGLALALAVAFGFAPGLAMDSAQLRPDVTALAFLCLGLLAGAAASRTAGLRRALVLLAAAAAAFTCAGLARVTGVPAGIAMAGVLAVLPQRAPPGQDERRLAFAWLAFGLALALPGAVELAGQVGRWQPYHAAVPAAVLGGLALSAGLNRSGPWRAAAGRAAAGLGAVLAGFGLAWALNLLHHDTRAIWPLANLLDHVRTYAYALPDAKPPTAAEWLAAGWRQVASGEGWLALLIWPALGAALLARPAPRTALPIVAALAMAVAVQVVLSLRTNPFYRLYSEPLLVLAAGLGLQLLPWRRSLAAGGFGLAVLVLAGTLAEGRAERGQGHANACNQAHAYLKRIETWFDAYCR